MAITAEIILSTMHSPDPHFRSLEDFLISRPLDIDGQYEDGWGEPFPVKGREIEATVLFSDIAAFSERTQDLSPAETLFFVNNFFAWISAEAIRGCHGIVDKYIGDEIMIVFSREFGSEDPFAEAVRVARWMGQNDVLAFCPHVGIASGPVIVGYVGTSLKYNCSVFGRPVALAARCAAVKPEAKGPYGAAIVFPAEALEGREVSELAPPERYRNTDGSVTEALSDWELLEPRSVEVKRTSLNVRELVKTSIWIPNSGSGAEDRAREGLIALKKAGLYRPNQST